MLARSAATPDMNINVWQTANQKENSTWDMEATLSHHSKHTCLLYAVIGILYRYFAVHHTYVDVVPWPRSPADMSGVNACMCHDLHHLILSSGVFGVLGMFIAARPAISSELIS